MADVRNPVKQSTKTKHDLYKSNEFIQVIVPACLRKDDILDMF